MQVQAKPELLAPAGNWDCVRAAVANGADAVYLGLDAGFNARARATNFALEDLPDIIGFAHARQVKVYVTLNTLVFPDELESIEGHIRCLAENRVDAILVQDVGLARLARAIAPHLVLHASTQMTLTSSQAIGMVESLGIARVVCARELSLDEIRRIGSECTMPLEVFIHGALCVAYSGQCLTSESLGGRSANRGECAQACRLDYQLVCDGQDVDLGDQKYLLSPQDLAAYELVPELIDAGVCSFKIEGRLKSPEYVANMCQHYRRAIDAAWEGGAASFSEDDVEEMELSFSRGFSPGWLGGCDHKRLVPATSSAKRGVMLGKVVRVDRTRVWVELEKSVKRGDGVVFEGDRVQGTEQGGRVYEVFVGKQSVIEPVRRGIVGLTFAHGLLDLSRVRPGLKVWKNDDPELNRRLRKSYEGRDRGGSIGLSLDVEAVAGQPLRVAGRSDDGRLVAYVGTEPLPVARKQVITAEELQRELSRLGHTDFELESLQCTISGDPMVPRSILGGARHAVVEQLESSAAGGGPADVAPQGVLGRMRAEIRERGDAASRDVMALPLQPQLHVLCRSLEQLNAAIDSPIDTIYVDFSDIRLYREAVSQVHAAGRVVYLATPRIQKPDEVGVFRAMAKHGADGFLVRNLGAIAFCNEVGIPWIGDFSLNATNELSMDWYRSRGSLRMTPSYDLNRDQLADLVRATRPEHLEVVIHQHMPMFHMEHCVFCAVMSPGTNKHNCGRPCDTHQVRLRDRVGMEHPLTADVGCRNTLFNAVPQSAAEAVPGLLQDGVRHFRVELLETTDTPAAVLSLYRQLLNGKTDASSVWRQLKAQNRVGVTRGTLEERRNPLAII